VTEIPAEISQLNATIFMYFPTCLTFKFYFPITSIFFTVNTRNYKSCRIILESSTMTCLSYCGNYLCHGRYFSKCHACHVNTTVIRLDGCERNQ
jgi:hypothetical protein